MGLTQLFRTGLESCGGEPCLRSSARQLPGARARWEPGVPGRSSSSSSSRCPQDLPAREGACHSVCCGKHLVKIKRKGSTHQPEIKCLHLISGRALRSDNLLGVWANCTRVSRNVFTDIDTSAMRAKKNILWSALPRSIPPHPFAMFRREKFSTDFQKAFDAVSITCFHLNSPATDTILIASGKTERVPALCSAETLLGPARPHRSVPGAGRRYHPARTPRAGFSISPKDGSWKLIETIVILTKKNQNTASSYRQITVPAIPRWFQSKKRGIPRFSHIPG